MEKVKCDTYLYPSVQNSRAAEHNQNITIISWQTNVGANQKLLSVI